MIKISALFLISFLAMNSCLEISPINDELLPSQSNKAQLIDIMVEVKTEGDSNTVGGFMEQLREMLTKLVKAQNKHRVIHAKMMKQCIDEDNFRRKEIAAAKLALARSLAARARCQASLKNAMRELPLLQSTLRTYVNELKRATAVRNVEVRKYKERRASFREALKFLREFMEYVTKRMSSGYKAFALAEFSENLLKHSAKLNVMTAAVPVLMSIATERKASDYTYRANQGLGAKLRTALTTLLARIQTDNNANEKAEKLAAAAFKKYSARLNKVINTLRRNIQRVKKQIVAMTKCVEHETQILKLAAKKQARNAVLKANAAKMCKSFNKEFIEATYNRLNEIKTMKEILVIVAKRFKDLPKDLVKYLEEVKDGWVVYVNSTKFKKFVEYERTRYAVNKRGKLLGSANADKDPNATAAVVRGAHGITKD
jgi:Txe/YoeB family toxin of Txe-Axe toxin-antitoxin module